MNLNADEWWTQKLGDDAEAPEPPQRTSTTTGGDS